MDRIITRNIFKSRTLVILDAGHGINTPGKRSPIWSDGTQLFEWEFNRNIVSKISRYLTASLISNIRLVQTDNDIPLKDRAILANKLYEQYKEDYFVYLVSVHGNAFDNPSVSGVEAFSTVDTDVSDKIADIHLDHLIVDLGWKLRPQSSVKKGKDVNFYILNSTDFPSILTESGFYTNPEECKKMLDPFWRNRIAMAHLKAMVEIEFNKDLKYDYIPKY